MCASTTNINEIETVPQWVLPAPGQECKVRQTSSSYGLPAGQADSSCSSGQSREVRAAQKFPGDVDRTPIEPKSHT